MQAHCNELEILIGEAFRRGDPSYLCHVLGIIYNKVDLRHSMLQKGDLEKLNRLAYKADSIGRYYVVGLTYDLIFSSALVDISGTKADALLAIANALLLVLENTKGTALSDRIAHYARIVFNILLERTELPQKEIALINSLLKGESLKSKNILNNFDTNDDVTEIIQYARSRDLQDRVVAVIRLLDLLTYCATFQEQIEVFGSKMLPIIKLIVNGTNEHCLELFEVLGTFIETMIFQSRHHVTFDKKCFEAESSLEKNPELFIHVAFDELKHPTNSHPNKEEKKENDDKVAINYALLENENVIRQFDGVYATVLFVLETYIQYPKLIPLQIISLRVIERLYHNYPAHRKNLEELLLKLLSNINPESIEEIKKPAAAFLYRLIHRDASSDFKSELENNESIKFLFSHASFDAVSLIESEVTDMQDLMLRVASPFNRTVEAGQIKSEYVEIWQPYSILSFGLAVLQHDIRFSIHRVARFKQILKREKDEPYTILKSTAVDAAKLPIKGNILIKEPGIYRFEFDNKGSWFNAKTIRYRIFVLSPSLETSELKAKQAALIDASLGHVLLPSQIYGTDVQVSLDSARGRHPASASNVVVSKSSDRTRILLYINSRAVEFSAVGSEKEYEIALKHKSENEIEWEANDAKISELLKKITESESGHERGGSLDIQLVYEEDFMEKELKSSKTNPKFREHIEQYFFKHISALGKMKKHLKTSVPQLLSEMEFQIQKLVSDGAGFNFKNFIVFVLDHKSKEVCCKVRKETMQILDITLEDFAVPVYEAEIGEDERLKLVPAQVLLFDEEQPVTKRVGYLAFLVNSIFCSSIKAIHDFVILEDTPTLFPTDSQNRTILQKTIDAFCHKGKKDAEQSTGLVDSLNIHFCEVSRDTNIKL